MNHRKYNRVISKYPALFSDLTNFQELRNSMGHRKVMKTPDGADSFSNDSIKFESLGIENYEMQPPEIMTKQRLTNTIEIMNNVREALLKLYKITRGERVR